MDNKDLYQKAEKALNQAFDAAKQSVKVVSEKAGEATHLTKLYIEKLSLEHKVNKKLTELGNSVYQQAVREGKTVDLEEEKTKSIVAETKELDKELASVEATLQQELKKSNNKKEVD